MDMGEDDTDLPATTSALDLNDEEPRAGETLEQAQARHEKSHRVSSGVKLTEREQFQMYKAESGASKLPAKANLSLMHQAGHGANVVNLRPDRSAGHMSFS